MGKKVLPMSKRREVAEAFAAGATWDQVVQKCGVSTRTIAAWKRKDEDFQRFYAEALAQVDNEISAERNRLQLKSIALAKQSLAVLCDAVNSGDVDAARFVADRIGILRDGGHRMGIEDKVDRGGGITVVLNTAQIEPKAIDVDRVTDS